MKSFTYERAGSVEGAVKSAQAPGARYIGVGALNAPRHFSSRAAYRGPAVSCGKTAAPTSARCSGATVLRVLVG